MPLRGDIEKRTYPSQEFPADTLEASPRSRPGASTSQLQAGTSGSLRENRV